MSPGVAPAGVEHEKTGQHHLIVDAPLPALDKAIPKDEHYRHVGGGQTETTLELSPGAHTLQLLLGDHNHIPHARAIISPVTTVTMK
jgi:hypothetical protein